MYPILYGSVAVALLSAGTVAAQNAGGITFGVGPPGGRMTTGGFRMSTPTLAAPGPTFRSPIAFGARGGRGLRGGYYGFYPYSSAYYGGFGGGFVGGYAPDLDDPGPGDADPYPLPPFYPFGVPAPFAGVSGAAPASLALQFPTPAAVWLNGTAVPGSVAADRTLTSPVLRPGERYTFHVRARWEANGQTYESTKDVTLGPGDRSRLLVLSGTAVTDGK